MRFIDKKYLIENIAERWRVMYEPFRIPSFKDRKEIYDQLAKLGKTPPGCRVMEWSGNKDLLINEIDKIIGNNTWTTIVCRECGNEVDGCVAFGNTVPCFEVCEVCLTKALKLFPRTAYNSWGSELLRKKKKKKSFMSRVFFWKRN